MAHPPLISRDSSGRAVYDLSQDEKLAAEGDEAAQQRLATKRRLAQANHLQKLREIPA